MTEDQIIAEAKHLAAKDRHVLTFNTFVEAVARHALRLAKQPEQDPALVKAMEDAARITALEADNERLRGALSEALEELESADADLREMSNTLSREYDGTRIAVIIQRYGGPHDAD